MLYTQHTRILISLSLLLSSIQQFSGNQSNHIGVDAALYCSDNSYCEQMIRPGSYCIQDNQQKTNIDDDGMSTTPPQGVCSNPFESGCIKTLLQEKQKSTDENMDEILTRIQEFQLLEKGRICNSDDVDYMNNHKQMKNSVYTTERTTDNCRTPLFDYDEIRIHESQWASGLFLAWIYQIILMEILDVPVALGLGPSGVGPGSGIQDNTYDASFYNPYNSRSYSSEPTPWKALEVASRIGDCNLAKEIIEMSSTSTQTKTIEKCAHVIPDVWNGQVNEWMKALRQGYIDPLTEGNGQIAKTSWYIPRYTVSNDGLLQGYYGIRGEENRQKLAETFKRPLQWKDYCELISTTNCTIPDIVTSHYPASDSEQTSYFKESSYTGYFHFSEKNNCTKNPTTCTGAFIGPLCKGSTNIDAQLYWNDIVGLEQDGPEEPNGGYSWTAMEQIWRAANATKSNVLMSWYKPDTLVEEFFNTSYEFHPFTLPEPNNICVDARLDEATRCSADINVRRGVQEGACDMEAHTTKIGFSRALREMTLKETNLAYRSPAYDFLNNIKITELQMNEMLRRWISMENSVDKYGYEPRMAVCSWIVDNLDHILDSIPRGYPKVLETEQSYHNGLRYTAIAVASCTNIYIWILMGATYYYRDKRVMIYAQPYFVHMLLFGFQLISIAAILVVLQPPTDVSCTMAVWFIALGYTIELVPLLVKISAINKVIQASKKMKRVQISYKDLAHTVIGLVAVVIIYLMVWTFVDPLASIEEHALATNTEDSIGMTRRIVSDIRCDCEYYTIWYDIIVGGQAMLLVMATILAYLSRNVQQEFNESRTLGSMIYSHFIFLILRIICIFINESYNEGENTRIFPTTLMVGIFSLLFSFDTLAALCIYVVPKVRKAALSSDSKINIGNKKSPAVAEIEANAERAACKQRKHSPKNTNETDSDIERDCHLDTIRTIHKQIGYDQKADSIENIEIEEEAVPDD